MEEKALLTFENFPQEKVTLIREFVGGKENASKIANTFHIRLPRDYDYYVECKSIFLYEMDTYGKGQKCYIKKNTSGPLSLNEKGTVNPAYNIDDNQIPWLILRNLVPTNSTSTDLTPAISYTIDPLACVVTQEVKVDYKGLVRYWYKYSGDNLDNDKIEKITENLLMYMGDGRHVQYRKSPTEGMITTYQFGKKTTIEKYVQGEGYYYEANIDGIVPTYKLFFKCDGKDLQDIVTTFNLTEQEEKMIFNANVGECVFMAGVRKMYVIFKLFQYELELIDSKFKKESNYA